MSASPFRRFWHRVLVWSGPAVLILLAFYSFCWWGSERLWFESLGYGAHFGRLLWWRAGAFGAGALFFALWLGVNAQVAWRNAAARAVPLSFFQSDAAPRLIPLEDKLQLDRYRRRVTVGTVLGLSFGAGVGFSARYGMFVRAFSVVGTGQRESASNIDLAFFLFSLPFYQWLSRVLLGAIVTALVLVSAIYLYEETFAPPAAATSGLKARVSRASQPAARHLAILWSMLLLWKGADCLLAVPLSFVSSGNVAARVFDPVDIRLGWTSAALFAFSAPLVALLSGLSLSRAPRGRVFGAGAIWMLGAGAIPFLLPLVAGRSPSDPNWKSALSRHIHSTRRAWGLEATERRSLALAPDAPFRAVARESGFAAENFTSPLALWPASSAKDALNARLSSHGANFRVAQVFLERAGDSLRYVGLGVPQIPPGDAPWRARHQRSSRGLWVQMEAARVAPDGAPVFQPDIAAPALVGAPRALEASTRSRNSIEPLPPIETSPSNDADEWIFTATTVEEFLTEADSSATRGVSLRGLGARWMTATRFFEPQLLRTANANDQMTWHRGAAERCRALAPFLDWRQEEARPVLISDADVADSPVSTKNEGEAAARLFYLVPGLIWSDDYPDSATPAPIGTAPPGANYGRHIALGAVDARSGAVTLYALDEDEPFMALYNRAFPALFRPPASLPNPIRAAIRPSAALLNAQTLIWARYHHGSSDRESLAWAAQSDNYRPLLSPEEGALPLASQSAGDWQCVAYARPEGQIGGGAVSPLISILGADERDFAARGARVRFVEWKARAPVHLPDLLAEPTLRLVANRPALPPPTQLGLAPRFDEMGNAIGLVAARGEAKLLPQKTSDARRQNQLETQIQVSGAAEELLPTTPLSPRASGEVAARRQIQTARAAWRDLQIVRRRGDWEALARAEKRLDDALGEKAPASGATGTH